MAGITRRQAAAALAAGALARPALGQPAPGRRAGGPRELDEVLDRIVAGGGAPGAVAAAATDRGPFHTGAAGKRNAAKGPEMTPDSVFWIASMTKAITSAAAMQLVERGKLRLDAPASEVLPDLLGAPQVLEGFGADGEPRLRPAKRPVTLRHLLTHTAGFAYDTWDAALGRHMKATGLPPIGTCRNDALKAPLVFDPGERWEYGINIDLVGKMVEAVSGERLGEYMRENIFAPLGMGDTGFRISPSQRARLVSMHTRAATGGFQPIDFEIPQDPEFEMGGGGLYSTAPDYLRFAQAFLHGGELQGARILRPETVAEMSRNQIGDIPVTKLATQQPERSADAEFFPGTPKRWGLGFMLNTAEAPTGRSAGSLAWAGLGNTYFWIDPRKRVAGVILMQYLPFADPKAIQALHAYESEVYKATRST
jgi:CubicO group peptidase (beta-lactamase class C family)